MTQCGDVETRRVQAPPQEALTAAGRCVREVSQRRWPHSWDRVGEFLARRETQDMPQGVEMVDGLGRVSGR